MTIKKWTCLGAVFFAALMMLAANGQQGSEGTDPEGDLNLRVYRYYGGADKEVMDRTLLLMEERMPDVEWELIPRPDEDEMFLKTAAAVGNLPDVFESDPSLISAFKESGDIAKLDDIVAAYDLSSQYNTISEEYLWDTDGSCWAIIDQVPYTLELYINKKVFDEAGVPVPTNYDELLAVAPQLQSKGIIPLALFSKEAWPGIMLWDRLVSRELPEGYIGVERGTVGFDHPAFLRGARKLQELVQAGLIGKAAFNTDYSQANELFRSGKAAMLQNGSWQLRQTGDWGEDFILHDNIFATSAQKGSSRSAVSGGGAIGGWSVAQHSDHLDIAKKAAAEFALARAEVMVNMGLPSPFVDESIQPDNPLTSIRVQYFNKLQEFETMTAFPWQIQNNEFKTALEEQIQMLLTGNYAPEDFIAYMQKLTEEIY